MNDVETGYEEATKAALDVWNVESDSDDLETTMRECIEAAAPYIEQAAEEKVKRELLERLSTPAAVDAFHAALPGPQRYSVVDTIAALRAAYEASTTQPLAGADDER